MNSHVREELVHATNDWYKHTGYIKPGNRVIIVQEGHPHNNAGGSIISIDTQMGTVTIVMGIINQGGNSRIIMFSIMRHQLMTMTIGSHNIKYCCIKSSIMYLYYKTRRVYFVGANESLFTSKLNHIVI